MITSLVQLCKTFWSLPNNSSWSHVFYRRNFTRLKKQKCDRRLFGAIDVDLIFLVLQFVEPIFCKRDRFFHSS